ncbi:MAG TPA: porin [Burkholderiales bacterium]|nr:porin [Burkholderiales bacterium]
MKKLFLASAVSALFATPTAVLAQAKPGAVPTLDKVLEASGISVSGYIDVGYTHADRNVEPLTGGFSPRVFDQQNNSFGLNQFGLSVAKQPKTGFGGLVNLTVGKDAQVIHSFPEAALGPVSSTFDVTQAYAQYARGPLTLIAGKFVTLQGSEVIWSPTNPNVSHSILFGAIPFTHTGVRGAWALNDQVTFYAGLNNGWDQLTDSNRPKTVELGASLNPIKPLSITVTDYSGKENVPTLGVPSPDSRKRNSFNAVASYTISDPLSVGVEYLNVSQENVAFTKQKYNGVALYGTYMFTPRYRGVLRYESFDDKDGLRFGPTGQKYKEVTVTGAYLPADNFELRAEVRRDSATNPVFPEFAGPLSKSLMTLALQGLYKF